MLVSLTGIVPAGAQEPATADTASAPQEVPSPAPPLVPGPRTHVVPDDKRRTLRSYGHNLAYNFLAVLQQDNHEPLLITATLTGASLGLDDTCEQYFTDHPHENFGKIGASLGSTVAVAGVTIGLFSAGRISRGDRFRAASYDLSQAFIVTEVYTWALKLAVQRERPDGSDNRSFPSGHASNAFAIASVISRHYKKLAIPAYAFGTYVAVSRMAAQKHFFSDIVAGSGLGLAIGRVVVRRNGRPPDPKPGEAAEPPAEKTTWDISPWAGPSGDGRGLMLVVRF
jgi:PAP2 superfamily